MKEFHRLNAFPKARCFCGAMVSMETVRVDENDAAFIGYCGQPACALLANSAAAREVSRLQGLRMRSQQRWRY